MTDPFCTRTNWCQLADGHRGPCELADPRAADREAARHARALRISARRMADAAELNALHDAYITFSLGSPRSVLEGGIVDPDVATLESGVRALALRIARRALRTK